jgi:NAD(P) transhydrogenase
MAHALLRARSIIQKKFTTCHTFTRKDLSTNAKENGKPLSHMIRELKASEHFDLIVIGSGPAGQKCAIDHAKHGKSVAIIDKRDMLGGVCVHTGTVPSKVSHNLL